jgi:hypothetical protein
MTSKVVKGQERLAKIKAVSERRALRDEVRSYSAFTGKLFTQTQEEVVTKPVVDERKTPDCGVRRTTPGVDEYSRNGGKKRPEGRRSVDLAPDTESDAEVLAIQAEEED